MEEDPEEVGFSEEEVLAVAVREEEAPMEATEASLGEVDEEAT
jgi:hypothetical protein